MSIIKAHSELIAALAAIKPHAIPTRYPEPEDFLQRAAHMRDVALAVDTYILALGRDCAENVRSTFDLSLFVAPLTNAIDGNAIYELECCAKDVENENEMYHEARYEGVGG